MACAFQSFCRTRSTSTSMSARRESMSRFSKRRREPLPRNFASSTLPHNRKLIWIAKCTNWTNQWTWPNTDKWKDKLVFKPANCNKYISTSLVSLTCLQVHYPRLQPEAMKLSSSTRLDTWSGSRDSRTSSLMQLTSKSSEMKSRHLQRYCKSKKYKGRSYEEMKWDGESSMFNSGPWQNHIRHQQERKQCWQQGSRQRANGWGSQYAFTTSMSKDSH